jgi:hypothetical protein
VKVQARSVVLSDFLSLAIAELNSMPENIHAHDYSIALAHPRKQAGLKMFRLAAQVLTNRPAKEAFLVIC